jgi:glucose-1-phosphate thymidylyltransferase
MHLKQNDPDDAFNIIRTLVPSGRGEYEICDVINDYLKRGVVVHTFVDGWWTDAGTMKSYKMANEMMNNGEWQWLKP